MHNKNILFICNSVAKKMFGISCLAMLGLFAAGHSALAQNVSSERQRLDAALREQAEEEESGLRHEAHAEAALAAEDAPAAQPAAEEKKEDKKAPIVDVQEAPPPAPAAAAPILKIMESGKNSSLYSIELRNTPLVDFFRVLAHDYDLNILVDEKVSGTVTASLTNISLEEALASISEMNNLAVDKKGNVIVIKPNLLPQVFVLDYAQAKDLLEEAAAGTQQATIYSLLSGEGKLFLGKQPNSIMVIDYPENVEKIKLFLGMADKKVKSRVFKLKYINAKEIVGKATAAQ